jgi:hypothetical protein
MQHSFKHLFKSYYIYTTSLLNLFKTTLYTTCFDRQWSSSGVLKLFVETAVLAYFVSNVRCVVPPQIRVFLRAGYFLLLRCVFKPRVFQAVLLPIRLVTLGGLLLLIYLLRGVVSKKNRLKRIIVI